ncbi:hypothetical protein SAMN06269250_2250 [Spirosoma fluviale]|uniref:Uncharacterized protein n=1 Tax=Spirosoma fluviale TaxID=1597977 RepID=A0A286FHQ9_9BACT|nr:hypothetical protein SAMN06269250_2250 [Spirosoma fluviale]
MIGRSLVVTDRSKFRQVLKLMAGMRLMSVVAFQHIFL